jgi:AraC family transcriptional regulator of adaptative response / DNA-3-methyladenine glycosylase II
MNQLDRQTCYAAVRRRDAAYDGVFFTAVNTTGIYCRPVCPAVPPKLENVEFMPSAAAAQAAGYRPCLRCRPELSPAHPAWHGTRSSVGRALRLIEAGAMNEGGVEELAARLGIGDRQLRRLFLAHLGATPVQVAQTRRVLLAKQLLTDTRLPMTEIALAAGFGSVRRFNALFRRMYGTAPQGLRRVTGAEREMIRALPFGPPYDWKTLRAYLARMAKRKKEMER